MDDKAKFRKAQQRVAAIKGFYIHLAIFVLVIGILFVVDFATGGVWWVQWPFLGWGAGVLAHAFGVFGGSGPNVFANWEKRKIKELMDKEE